MADQDSRAADSEWVERIRAGDTAAFFELYRAHHDALCRYVYRYVHSRPTAEDLVHDVFLRLWMQREGWKVRESVRSYLYASARSRALDHLKHERVEARGAEAVLRAEEQRQEWETPSLAEQGILSEELAAAIQRAVDELPPRPREVLMLRWQRHLGNAQIAEELGIAVKTVEMHMARAIEGLRERLSGALRDEP